MATGVGDLVANLSVDRSQWSAGLNAAKHEAQDFGEHAETHAAGASRAFRFLGKEITEGGEALSKQNEALGSTVEHFGGVTQGIGEAVHGFHALHAVMDIQIGKQTVLNALSGPAGWITLAAAAAAAGGAYLYFSSTTNEAAEAAKKLAEEQKKLKEEGEKKVDTTITHLKEEIEKAKSPVEQFNDALRDSGRSSKEVAKVSEEFRKLRGEVDKIDAAKAVSKERHDAEDIIKRTRDELARSGLSKGEEFEAKFKQDHPNAFPDQNHRAFELGQLIDKQEIAKQQQEERERETDKAQEHAKTLTEAGKSPMEKIIEDAQRLRAEFDKGLISADQLHAGGRTLEREAAKQARAEEKPPPPLAQAEEKNSDAAFKTILEAMYGGDQVKENAQKTADATQKIAQILGDMQQKSSGKVPDQVIDFGP